MNQNYESSSGTGSDTANEGGGSSEFAGFEEEHFDPNLTGAEWLGNIDWTRVGFSMVGVTLSGGEAALGLIAMGGSFMLGPFGGLTFPEAAFLTVHGSIGALNSGIDVIYALHGVEGPGFFEATGGVLGGDYGGRAGALLDLGVDIPGAVRGAGQLAWEGLYDAGAFIVDVVDQEP